MTKGYLASALTGLMMLASGSAALAAGAAGEFGNNCALGLTNGVKKYTDCSVSEKIDGKVYCFSTQSAKEEFMKDPARQPCQGPGRVLGPIGFRHGLSHREGPALAGSSSETPGFTKMRG